jgi:hypothetical protein
MATPNDKPSHAHRWVIVGVLLVLLVIGLLSYGVSENRQADAKADELIAALERAGLPTPESRDTIVNALGDDGGAVCEDPGSSLRKALLDQSLVNGASFVGQRPIRADGDLLRAQLIVLRVYCPDEIDGLRDRIDDYRVDDVDDED